ncbi:MAG: N-acetylmuramidase domain-containing protein [Phycisphaerae bacterium]
MPNNPSPSNSPSPDDELARIIMRIESGCRFSAMRFEPDVYGRMCAQPDQVPLLNKIRAANLCDLDTADVIFSTSYGLFQLMGFNLYDLGFTGTVLQFWISSNLQREYFARFLDRNGINYTWSQLKANAGLLEKFVSVYNGPGNVEAYRYAMLRSARGLGL